MKEGKGIDALEQEMLNAFGYDPTGCQRKAMRMLSEFLFSENTHALFLLKGYAGTGKTTLISTFVKVLDAWRIRNVLLAPTGRAAKVLGGYSGKPAHTIHRYIYRVYTAQDGKPVIIPAQNKGRDTIFIVDEVSMVSGLDQSDDQLHGFSGRDILDDLIQYVYSAENCKMIFIGDQAQLPPVGTSMSPALDAPGLSSRFSLNVILHALEEVVRQEAGSGILYNATQLRRKIAAGLNTIPFLSTTPRDVKVVYGQDLLDELADAYSRYNQQNAVVITRSNKRANLYNQEIRKRILYREYEIEGGDLMMVVKNNYYWLPENSPAGFIANGDLLEVQRIRNIEERFGFRFADALVVLSDYPDEPQLEVKILLSSIQSENASLSRTDQTALFHAVKESLADENQGKRNGGVSSNPYYNALQVKFAYALTCHKTQGGQWEKVFIDQGWLPEDKIDVEFFRWLYTAVTRATRKLWLVGFHEAFIEEDPVDPQDADF
jgi:exodeoxyribonuclease V